MLSPPRWLVDALQAGLIDHHTHLMQWMAAAAFPERRLDLHGARPTTLEALADVLLGWWTQPDHAARLRLGPTDETWDGPTWVHAVGLLEPRMAGGGWRQQLDAGDWSWLPAELADVPIALRRICGHRAWLSPAAVRRLRSSGARPPVVQGDEPLPPPALAGPWIRLQPLLDTATPEALGAAIVEGAVYDIEALLTPQVGELAEALRAAQATIFASGVRAIHDIVRPPYPAVYAQARDEGWLALHVGMLHRVLVAGDVAAIEDDEDLGPTADGGRVWTEGAKVFLDGSLGSHTAALREPYTDRPAESGVLLVKDAELAAILDACEARGWPLAMHAIGDAAVEQGLAALERRAPATNADGALIRHRIEHAQLVPPDLRPRMLALRHRLRIVPQASFSGEGLPGGFGWRRVGARRARWLNPIRWWLAAGFDVAYSSDMLPFDAAAQLGGWNESAAAAPRDHWARRLAETGRWPA